MHPDTVLMLWFFGPFCFLAALIAPFLRSK